jgi:hypothetical protein
MAYGPYTEASVLFSALCVVVYVVNFKKKKYFFRYNFQFDARINHQSVPTIISTMVHGDDSKKRLKEVINNKRQRFIPLPPYSIDITLPPLT